MSPADRLCLALDFDDQATAVEWVRRTAGRIGTYKVGLQAFCAHGPRLVDAVRAAGAPRIFLDLKLHDIPNTVAKATARIAALGVDLLTVHASGGEQMLRAAGASADGTALQLLAVTVLTSLGPADLAAVGCRPSVEEAVEARARLLARCAIAGLVCSPHEVARLRPIVGPDCLVVTPGIRLPGAASHDQTRVADPATAIRLGADLLVVGRTVTAATDPDAALTALHGALS